MADLRNIKFIPLALLTSFLVVGCWEAGTEYSSAKVKSRFPTVKIGDSVSEVYQQLGPPLFFSVNPDIAGNGGSQQKTFGTNELNEVLRMLADTNVEAYLHYSQPGKLGQPYYKLYMVVVREGHVVSKTGPAYMD